ncbi:MAG: autotransporter domain-containing protein [Proteobacteria bacterium]|nr:autotransporter domain-containing protein [Pseudomonadota bacterium]
MRPVIRSLFSFPSRRFVRFLMLPLPLVLLGLCLALAPSPARCADSVAWTSDGGTYLLATGFGNVSADGTTVVGYVSNEAALWSDGTLTGLGFLDTTGTYEFSRAYGVSADGSVVVGDSSDSDNKTQAFRWSGGTMTGLGFLDTTYKYSSATGVSANGSVVVGDSSDSADNRRAFRWTESSGVMTDLGTLGGHDRSGANAVSADGLVVVGDCYDSGYSNYEAFRWVSDGTATGGTMASLGFLDTSGTYTVSHAYGVSSDGSVVVGYSYDSDDNVQAFRWVSDGSASGGSMAGLGFLSSVSKWSQAIAVSTNGSVVVGKSYDDGGDSHAFYWTESSGMVTLASLLAAGGVDLTGWVLEEASGVSGDGTIIVGADTHGGPVYIARISGGVAGLTTTESLYQSLATMGQVGPAVSSMGQLSMSRLGGVAQGMGSHFAVAGPGAGTGAGPGAGPDTGARSGNESGLSSGDEMTGTLELWGIGSLGTNTELDGGDFGLHGGLGLTWHNGGEWSFGGGVFGDSRELDTDYTGSQRIEALGPGVFAVYSPQGTGLEFSVSALWQTVDLELTRGYMNGAGSATSSGNADAEVFGLSGRVQWTKDVNETLALTPFGEYTWQSVHIDSYTESDGPFPASFDSRNEESNSIRTGLRADVALFDKVGTWVWAAWDHRFEDTSSAMGGTTTGLGAFSYAGSKLDQDWADLGVGASWQLSERMTANASLGAAMGCDDDSVSDLTASVGFTYQLW